MKISSITIEKVESNTGNLNLMEKGFSKLQLSEQKTIFEIFYDLFQVFKQLIRPLVDLLPLDGFVILMGVVVILAISIVFANLFSTQIKSQSENKACLYASDCLGRMMVCYVSFLLIPGCSYFQLALFDCSFIKAGSIINIIIFILCALLISRIFRRDKCRDRSLRHVYALSLISFCSLLPGIGYDIEILMFLGAISILLQVRILMDFFDRRL